MLSNKIIQRVIAGLLVLVFGLSITPKKTLHDLMATHQDSPIQSGGLKTALLETTGFHCQCENLVVESPFVNDISPLQIANTLVFNRVVSSPEPRFISAPVADSSLRGPPAA